MVISDKTNPQHHHKMFCWLYMFKLEFTTDHHTFTFIYFCSLKLEDGFGVKCATGTILDFDPSVSNCDHVIGGTLLGHQD